MKTNIKYSLFMIALMFVMNINAQDRKLDNNREPDKNGIKDIEDKKEISDRLSGILNIESEKIFNIINKLENNWLLFVLSFSF